MHHTLADGTVFFLDCFGLSRVGRDGAVKNVPQALASPRRRFVVREGTPPTLWTPWQYTHTTKVLDAETLKPIATHKPAPELMLPDGRLLRSYGSGPAQFRIVEEASKAEATPPLVTRAAWDEAETRPSFDLGLASEPVALGAVCLPVASGQHLLFVLDGQLACAAITATTASLRWRAPLKTRADSVLQVFPSGDEFVMVSVAPRAQRAHALRVGWNGAPRGSVVELTLHDLAAFDGSRLVFQREPDTVVALDLVKGEEQTWSIAAVTAAARAKAKKGKALAFDNAGIGKVVAGAGRVLFVPAHRESLLDLLAEEELSRKLKAAEQQLRQTVTRWLRAHRAALIDAGLLDALVAAERNDALDLSFWSWTSGRSEAVVKRAVKDLTAALGLQAGMSGVEC